MLRGGCLLITCQELADRLAELLSGRLSAGDRLECEGHLSGCASCRAFLESHRRVIGLVRSALTPPPGEEEEMPEELVQSFLRALS